MKTIEQRYGVRRVYETTPSAESTALRLKDRVVDLGTKEYSLYAKLVEWLPTNRESTALQSELGLDAEGMERMLGALEQSGLLYKKEQVPASLSGEEFHRDYFSKMLPSWLDEAFSHPFWERMMEGKGSARLFAGWMIELYHYTLNANRHMPLSCAYAKEKPLKALRAKHYAEEWNHYHYFMKSLKALGFNNAAITDSVPLPMTLALSNFMRQAAREDVLMYSICSAVLEGTTTDRGTFNPYYEKSVELYGIPREAIAPIYAHLDLDVKYGHSDLFLEMLCKVEKLSAERANRILDYGHQLVEHIWLWTDNIEKYYDNASNPAPRASFDPQKRTLNIKTRKPGLVVLEHLDEEVVLEGAGADLFSKIAEYLNSDASIETIAQKTGESVSRVQALIEQLRQTGVVAPMLSNGVAGSFTMTGMEFYDLHKKYSAHWLRPVYDHPLWEKMTSGTATRAQVIGFAFEKYHYIEGAHEHMGIAAANATPEMMPHLARHFIEEYTHGDIYRKGLKSLFPDEHVLHAQPLPSTRALVNFLSETAARSSFAYYAGNEVLQMTENTGDADASNSIDDFYAAMRKHYPFSGKLIDSFIQHTNADQNLGHESVFKEMCESVPPLTLREVVDAMNVSRSMVEHLMLFMDGIDVCYAKNDVVPRMPCTLLSE